MRLLVLAVALAGLLAGPAVAAPPFPSRQITIVVPFAAGGPSDAMARLVAQGLGDKLGTRVLVENIPGAGGTIGSARVSRAEPDGHTLVFGNIGTHAANVGLYKALPYNPETDFEPVALIANVPFVVAAKRALALENFAGLRALARRADLRQCGHWFGLAFGRPAARRRHGRESAACSLSRRGAGLERPRRRPDRLHVRPDRHHD